MEQFSPKIGFLPFIRSVIFYLFYPLFSIIFCTLTIPFVFYMPLEKRIKILINWNKVIMWWLRVCCGVSYKVIGNLPEEKFVAVAKHQSQWETYFLQLHLAPTSIVLKKELLKLPFFGWGLSLEAPIAIDRSNPRAAIKDIMSQGLAYLSQGLNVLIFPEGTRVAVGEKGRYARSGAEMAIKAGVPLVPIAHNSGEHWLNKHFVKLPGTITVVIGDAINTEAHNNSKALCNQSEDWIEKTVSEISAGQYAELNPKEC